MKNNKVDSRKRIPYPDKVLIAKVIAAIILISLVMAIFRNLQKLEYFRVSEVIVRPGSNIPQNESNFVYFKGCNIFEFDLAQEAGKAADHYPSYQKIRITRFLPDHLVVDFFPREPLAYIRASRIFYIDENLFLFDLPNAASGGSLPVISGVDKYVLGAKYGSRCDSAAVAAALNIIKQAGENKVLKEYTIKKVDMSGFVNASIFFLVSEPDTVYTKTDYAPAEQIIEVKIGREDTRDKLALLAALLAQVKKNAHNIEYIDLRFKEPVIKFKVQG